MSNPDPAASASAAQPVAAQTLIITDADGLTAGEVSIPSADGAISAYRAVPQHAQRPPVALVVQEIFGLNEHIKDVARRLAKLGYLAVAPRLYQRQGDVERLASLEEIRALVARVPDAQVLSDLDACLGWAVGQGGDPQRAVVTGFCWGGRSTWLYAAHQPRLSAAVAWYGRLQGEPTPLQPRSVLDVAGELKVPVLGLYAGADASIPQETVERLRAELRKHGGSSAIHVYPDAPHAFYADYRPSYRAQPASDGWQRMQDWFREHGA